MPKPSPDGTRQVNLRLPAHQVDWLDRQDLSQYPGAARTGQRSLVIRGLIARAMEQQGGG